MTGETSIQMVSGADSARLVIEESLESIPKDVLSSLLRHVAFTALLIGLVALSTSLLAHFLIVRPVRELAAAAERIGTGGDWEPFSPSIRRRDELGLLCDRFAELSRRLLSAVRDERYGSAHLVALGVERGLEEPVRHAEMELALLQASLPVGSEELARCANLAAQLDEIAEVGRRLKTIGGHPPFSGA
jgi:methyl-accepting chemotaxis protein